MCFFPLLFVLLSFELSYVMVPTLMGLLGEITVIKI